MSQALTNYEFMINTFEQSFNKQRAIPVCPQSYTSVELTIVHTLLLFSGFTM